MLVCPIMLNHFFVDWIPLAVTEDWSWEEVSCWSSSSSSHSSFTFISFTWREAPKDVIPACEAPLFVPACSPTKPWPARNCSLVNFGRFFFWPPVAPVWLGCKGKSAIYSFMSQTRLMNMLCLMMLLQTYVTCSNIMSYFWITFAFTELQKHSMQQRTSDGFNIEHRLIDAISTTVLW